MNKIGNFHINKVNFLYVYDEESKEVKRIRESNYMLNEEEINIFNEA